MYCVMACHDIFGCILMALRAGIDSHQKPRHVPCEACGTTVEFAVRFPVFGQVAQAPRLHESAERCSISRTCVKLLRWVILLGANAGLH